MRLVCLETSGVSIPTLYRPFITDPTALGPKGRNVALDKKWGAPTISPDGVTVAKEIELPDPFQNMGAQLLKQAASTISDVAGDGTTTSTVLAQTLVDEGLRLVAAGANPLLLKRGLDKGVKALVTEIARQGSQQDSIDLMLGRCCGASVVAAPARPGGAICTGRAPTRAPDAPRTLRHSCRSSAGEGTYLEEQCNEPPFS